MKKEIQVAIVIVDDVLMSAVTGIEDIFSFANNFAKEEDEPKFKLSFVSAQKKAIISHSSASIKCEPISINSKFDIIIIPPIVTEIEKLFSYPKLIDWLIKMYTKGAILSSVCVGGFILAQTGLLDNKPATSHWLFEDEFKKAFPKIKPKFDKLLIEEERVITSAGATAYVNLVLSILHKYHSYRSVHKCSSLLLLDSGQKEQIYYKNLEANLKIDDIEIKNILQWIKRNIDKELSINIMAEKMNLQPRSFIRRFKNALNTTPNQYLQDLRIEEAKILLVNTKKSFAHITDEVGFNNESSFRRLFKKKTYLNPGEYRKKFQSIS